MTAAALSLLLSAVLVPQPQQPDLTILHFNDFHGQVRPKLVVDNPSRPAVERGGFWRLEQYVAARRAERGERLWLTNGGDWFQGTPEGTEDRGLGVAACFERLGVTVSVLGNHEYDFGERTLIDLVERFRHPVLGANVFERGREALRPYVRPYVVKSVDLVGDDGPPLRIAVVGLLTSGTEYVSTGPFGSADFRQEEATLEALWPALQRDADLVVLLTHCGLDRDQELAARFPEVALILGGHSHTELRRPVVVGDTTIVQSGSRGTALTELELDLGRDPPAMSVAGFRWVELDVAGVPPAATAAFLERQFGHVADRWDTPIGEIAGEPDTRRRSGSTPGGNLVADLIRAAGQADLAITNKGGIRSTLPTGPVTRRDVFELLPFENSVVTVELRGSELRELLARSLGARQRLLEIAGATYSYVVADGERHLREVLVGGRPLADERIYRVATNSFLARGGDGHEILATAPRRYEGERFLHQLLIERLAAGGPVVLDGEQRVILVQ